MEKVSFRTEDNVDIVGTWHEADGARGAALLLHMMSATRESYAELQKRLAGARISSLAIDLRGHGESVFCDEEARISYQDFDDSGHQASRFDVEAAIAWIRERSGFPPGRIVLVGASIGANLALAHAAAHQEIPAVAALSPGLVYRGIAATPAVTALQKPQRLLLVASDDDTYSVESVEKLAEVSLADTEVLRFEQGGHGTTLLESEPTLLEKLVTWIVRSLPAT
jgi:alpha-beta hydrolase superfamily lysophospholipase